MTVHIEPYDTLREACRRATILHGVGQHVRIAQTGVEELVVLWLDLEEDEPNIDLRYEAATQDEEAHRCADCHQRILHEDDPADEQPQHAPGCRYLTLKSI